MSSGTACCPETAPAEPAMATGPLARTRCRPAPSGGVLTFPLRSQQPSDALRRVVERGVGTASAAAPSLSHAAGDGGRGPTGLALAVSEGPARWSDVLLESGPPRVSSRSALALDDEGGFLAPTAAEQLVADGFSVEIATTHPVVGAEIDPTQQPFVFRRLALAGVVMTLAHRSYRGHGRSSSRPPPAPARSHG